MNSMFDFRMSIRPNLIFGLGALSKLGDETMPGKKALVLIDESNVARQFGQLDKLTEQLDRASVEYVVYDKIMQNPYKEVATDGAKFANENGCDFVIALGGGAVMDSAVGIAAMATNPGDLWDYVYGGTGKGQPLKNKGLPIITITTTSGTGSELNGCGVFSNKETQEKMGFFSPELTPVLTIVDPELMKTIPPKFTAYQGFDALFHNIEVVVSKDCNAFSEAVSLSAVENIAKYLPRAVKDGSDMEARLHVAYGSTFAAIPMQITSTISAHALEHAMSAFHHKLAHGAGLIIISKAYYEFFVNKHACDVQFIKLARAMGFENADKAEDFISALVKLQQDCDVADLKMSEYGFVESEFAAMAENARRTHGMLYYADPCELTDNDCVEIYKQSYR